MTYPILTRDIIVLKLGLPIMRRPELLDAALARIAELTKGNSLIIICPAPVIFAAALTKAGHRALVLSNRNVDAAFLRGIIELRAIPVLDGSQQDAIEFARVLDGARVILYTDSQAAIASPYASHVEVMELAAHGVSPVTDEAAREAAAHAVSYEIRSITDNTGTVIRANEYKDRSIPITSITASSGYALVSMGIKPPNPKRWKDLRMHMLERIADANISVELMQSFASGLRFLVWANRIEFVQSLAQEHELQFQAIGHCTKLCIVGTGVGTTAGVYYRGLAALAKAAVPVLHWADSSVTLSFVVNDTLAREAAKVLHAELAPGSDVALGSAISFDADLGLLRLGGRQKRLGARQAQLLRYLLENVGRIIEVEELARELFGAEGKEDVAAVRVHMHNLRKKVEENPDVPRHIVTVPEQGYVFVR